MLQAVETAQIQENLGLKSSCFVTWTPATSRDMAKPRRWLGRVSGRVLGNSRCWRECWQGCGEGGFLGKERGAALTPTLPPAPQMSQHSSQHPPPAIFWVPHMGHILYSVAGCLGRNPCFTLVSIGLSAWMCSPSFIVPSKVSAERHSPSAMSHFFLMILHWVREG